MTEPLEFSEDESQTESEEDIGQLEKTSFSGAVLSGNDWTTETIITQINKGNIQLNPNFQRRDAWDKTRKSKFIESLILGLPVPQIVLAESKERRGAYIVLDGKQRLLSIRQFAAPKDDKTYEHLKLSGLEIRKDLSGHSLESMRSDIGLFDDLSSFENQPIRTVVIKNWPNEKFLYHIFLRLNTGSVPLSPQELRQALHPGDFVLFLDKQSAESQALREILGIKKPDFRMRDTELLLRYIAYKNFLPQYTGSLKDFLDNACEKLNKNWEDSCNDVVTQISALEEAHTTTKAIFALNSYRKWVGMDYETRFNRSIFDIMSLSFSDPKIRAATAGKESSIEVAFKDLCASNKDFKTSIETTTKSIWATHTRISIWNSKLNQVLGTDLHVPTLIDNRIV
jgi:hypothetical protein